MGEIYLLTDFGDSPYTGILRAVARSLGVDVVDIDHSIPSFRVMAGAYVLAHTYNWAPKGSVIVAVVDPGVGTNREALAVKAGDYIFVGPNNGLLYPAVSREGFEKAVSLIPERVVEAATRRFMGKLPGKKWVVSSTFHARDVFTPAGALIALGVDMETLGTPFRQEDMRKVAIEYVERRPQEGYRARIVYIDKFGNVALSATPRLVPLTNWRKVMVNTGHGSYQVTVGRKFGDVNPGELVLYVNSFGHLEIAMNQGNAAKKLMVDIGDNVSILPLEVEG